MTGHIVQLPNKNLLTISDYATPPEKAALNEVLQNTSLLQRAYLVLAVTLPFVLMTWFCWHQRVQVLEAANRTAARSVVALEQHAANMLDVHMLILRQLDDLTQGRPGSQIREDAWLRESVAGLARDFPQVLARCQARAAFMREVIGMEVPGCLLPLADTCGIIAPWLLDPAQVLAL